MQLKDDWRLTGQEKYMEGVCLKRANPHKYAAQNGKTDIWREHCEFCMKTITKDTDEDCYTTSDNYRWVCKACFDDFAEAFGFRVEKYDGQDDEIK